MERCPKSTVSCTSVMKLCKNACPKSTTKTTHTTGEVLSWNPTRSWAREQSPDSTSTTRESSSSPTKVMKLCGG